MDYAIGSKKWPGLSKLIEEAGEVQQVVGKLVATDGREWHWDGQNLRASLTSELGDLMAAIEFVIAKNGLDEDAVRRRASEKFHLFCAWHADQKETPT